ncbi:MAG: hypothetical protein H8E44_04335 [Planctomycetes bacterium]|nr:hypothetical protein [Planctomycetota bacterium]
MKAELIRDRAPGGFNWGSGTYNRYKSPAMKWCVVVTGSPNGNADGPYFFVRKKDAEVAYLFATTEWDGLGGLIDACHEWMIRSDHELADSYKGEF